MEASNKSEAIDNLITSMMGKSRVETIAQAKCMTCGGDASEFRDDLSWTEYTISGMCQGCQDKVFGE
jgi:hypothetical protein